MHTCTCRKYPIIYINIQGYSKHSSYHTYTFFLERILTCMLKLLCQNYICSYPNYFATTNYPHTFEVFYKKKFCCSIPIYLYIYAHWRGNSTSYIHLGSILVPSLARAHFFERLLMLLIHKYTYFEMHYLLFIHFAKYFYAIYIYTYIYTPLKSISHVT